VRRAGFVAGPRLMRKLLVLLGLLAVLALLILRLGPGGFRQVYESVPRPSGRADLLVDGVPWREASAWRFRDGPFPNAWGWGQWRVVDGVLEGREDKGDFAVYFCPAEHGGDFLLETRVRILSDSTGRIPEAHLLTRDSRELHNESGAVLFGGQNKVSARHMVDRHDYVLRVIKPSEFVRLDAWHLLAFAVRDGRVFVWLDGRRIYRSDHRYPTGRYREPHLAVRNGVAQFGEFRLLVAP
jgi:hypothetical protein